MIRNENVEDGSVVSADIIDLVAGTVSREVNGTVVWTRPFTAEELNRYGPQPLDIKGPYGDEGLSSAVNGEVLSYNGSAWVNSEPEGQVVAAASTKIYSGGFFPGASMVGRLNNSSQGTNSQRLYFYWAPVQKELNITGLQIDVQTAGDSGALHRIGLFDYDLQDLSTDYDSFYYFKLRHDFGTLPLDVVGTQSIDLSSSPVVVPPGLYAVGVGSEFTGTTPLLNGMLMSYMSDVPACYTLVSSYVRSYSIPVWSGLSGSGQVTNGFQTTEIMANLANSVDAHQGLSTVLFQGYTTQ